MVESNALSHGERNMSTLVPEIPQCQYPPFPVCPLYLFVVTFTRIMQQAANDYYESIEVHIRWPEGHDLVLSVSPKETVSSLKQKVSRPAHSSIPTSSHSLFFYLYPDSLFSTTHQRQEYSPYPKRSNIEWQRHLDWLWHWQAWSRSQL